MTGSEQAQHSFSGRIGRLARHLGWTQDSYKLVGTLFLIVVAIIYFWWPLVVDYLSQVNWDDGSWWRYIDWLLIGVWAVMTLLLMYRANFRADLPLILVGFAGGLVIESWGTQTEIWIYYTLERPPLWIIPAWPVAAIAIERLAYFINRLLPESIQNRWFVMLYWPLFILFFVLMVQFVAPTFDKSLTIMALILCALIILSPTNYRVATLLFIAGAGLGYFLELWGTTRLCWIYYTKETPPFFAVLAHGMAAVAFWRVELLLKAFLPFLDRWGRSDESKPATTLNA